MNQLKLLKDKIRDKKLIDKIINTCLKFALDNCNYNKIKDKEYQKSKQTLLKNLRSSINNEQLRQLGLGDKNDKEIIIWAINVAYDTLKLE
jgi:hypothetical protein